MDRRKLFTAAALGLSLPALAFHSTEKVPILGSAFERVDAIPPVIPPIACRVVGVGGTGCKVATRGFLSGLQVENCHIQFSCADLDSQSIREAIEANGLLPGITPIRPVRLGRYGTHGNVNIARAAAQKHDNALRSFVDGADIVIITAGLGGGTGSAIGPAVAKMAMEVGALVLGVIVTPFKWELGRYSNAIQAVQLLERHSHYLVSLPNEKMGELLGMDATFDDVIAQQEVLAIACISKLLLFGHSNCIESRRRSA